MSVEFFIKNAAFYFPIKTSKPCHLIVIEPTQKIKPADFSQNIELFGYF